VIPLRLQTLADFITQAPTHTPPYPQLAPGFIDQIRKLTYPPPPSATPVPLLLACNQLGVAQERSYIFKNTHCIPSPLLFTIIGPSALVNFDILSPPPPNDGPGLILVSVVPYFLSLLRIPSLSISGSNVPVNTPAFSLFFTQACQWVTLCCACLTAFGGRPYGPELVVTPDRLADAPPLHSLSRGF